MTPEQRAFELIYEAYGKRWGSRETFRVVFADEANRWMRVVYDAAVNQIAKDRAQVASENRPS